MFSAQQIWEASLNDNKKVNDSKGERDNGRKWVSSSKSRSSTLDSVRTGRLDSVMSTKLCEEASTVSCQEEEPYVPRAEVEHNFTMSLRGDRRPSAFQDARR